MPIRILVVDDHRMVREGLRLLLTAEADLQLVGEAVDGQRAVEMADELRPDMVVMDIGLPVMDGIEATRQIKRLHPEINVVALSAHADRYLIEEMRAAGACGYVLKDMAFELLVEAIHKCLIGEPAFP